MYVNKNKYRKIKIQAYSSVFKNVSFIKRFFVSILIEKVAREISCKGWWGTESSLERKDTNWIEGDEGERARADECSR